VRLIREHGFRHLPIVDRDRRPLGIISSRDLLQFTVEGLERYVERRRGAQHREELTDPYDSMSL
jgi:CBS domain-containing protein